MQLPYPNLFLRLYYQYSPARLSTCTLTIHALLHIADGIEACGPVWAYWAFPMERYCSTLQRAVFNSRRHPYDTLDKYIAEDAMLSQLKIRYNLKSKLDWRPNTGVHSFSTPACEWFHSINTTEIVFIFVIRSHLYTFTASLYRCFTFNYERPDFCSFSNKVQCS